MNRASGHRLLLGMAALIAGAAVVAAEPSDVKSTFFSPASAPWQQGELKCLSRKGQTALYTGNSGKAWMYYLILEKKYPEHRLRLWEGMLLEQLGQPDRAALIFNGIAAGSQDKFEKLAALMYSARIALKKNNFIAALADFDRVLQIPGIPDPLEVEITAARIHTAIRLGRYEDAALYLTGAAQKFPAAEPVFDKLKLLNLVSSGQTKECSTLWRKIRSRFLPEQDILLFQILELCGRKAMENRSIADAELFYADAFEFAPDDEARRNTLKKLINVQSSSAPQRALKNVGRYKVYFPDAADVREVILLEGQLNAGSGNNKGALDIFVALLNDSGNPAELRGDAALNGAVAAEKLKDNGFARELYHTAIRHYKDRLKQNAAKMQLLEFLFRLQEFAGVAVLGSELENAEGVDQEQVNRIRMQALIKLKRYDEAVVIAGKLSGSRDPVWAAEGSWQSARLTELKGDMKRARELYLDFCKRFKDEKRSGDAMLNAADLALHLGRYDESFSELEDFIKKYPLHPGIAGALSGVVYSALRSGKYNDLKPRVNQAFEKLKKEFSESAEFERTVLYMTRYFIDKGDIVMADDCLQNILKNLADNENAAEALLLSATVFELNGNYAKTLEQINRLLDKYPGSKFAVDAAMKGGSNCFRNGDYRNALKYYERAGELSDRGLLSDIAEGEAADCHFQLRSEENLRAAVRIYNKLGSNSAFPSIKVQALYKLGLCYEAGGNIKMAVDAYEKLLTVAVRDDKVSRHPAVGMWCARAAGNALKLILGSNMPDGSQRAQWIYSLYSSLNLPGSSREIKNYLQEIRKHYNLLD